MNSTIHLDGCREEQGGYLSRSVLTTPRGNEHEFFFQVATPLLPGESIRDHEAHLLVHLFAAMRIGAPLHFEGRIDEVLLDNLSIIQAYWTEWFPDRLHRIEVTVDEVAQRIVEDQRSPKLVSCFSGGVDSYHTLLTASRDMGQEHGAILFLNGFDINVGEEKTYEMAVEHYRGMAAEVGVRLLEVHSNAKIYATSFDLSWGRLAHGIILAAALSLFSDSYGTACIPSSHSANGYRIAMPWGSNPVTDPFLSSSRQRVVHHGFPLSRYGKINELTTRPEWIKSLRVCWGKVEGKFNCGSCPKCLLTLLAFHVAKADSFQQAYPDVSLGEAIERFRKFRFVPYQLEQVRYLCHYARVKGHGEIEKVAREILNRDLKVGKSMMEWVKSITYRWKASRY